MIIKNLDQVEKCPVNMDGVKDAVKQLPIGKAEGSSAFSFRVFTLGPDGHTPYHTHPFEHVNYVIEGNGALVDKDGNEHPIQKGSFAFVQAEEKHQYRNTSASEPFVMICAVTSEYE